MSEANGYVDAPGVSKRKRYRPGSREASLFSKKSGTIPLSPPIQKEVLRYFFLYCLSRDSNGERVGKPGGFPWRRAMSVASVENRGFSKSE